MLKRTLRLEHLEERDLFADFAASLVVPPVVTGDRATVKLRIAELSGRPAHYGLAIVQVGNGLRFNQALSPPGTLGHGGHVYIPRIPSSGTTTFPLVFDVLPGVSPGNRNVTAFVHAWGDQNPGNNIARATLNVQPQADLSVRLSAPASVSQGQHIAIALNVRNSGPATAVNATVTIPVPPSLGVVGWPVRNGHVIVGLGTLSPGATASRVITFSTRNVTTETSAQFAATARATGTDPQPLNNVARVTTRITVPQQPLLVGAVQYIGAADSVVRNQSNVTALRLALRPETSQPVFVTALNLSANQGNLVNGQSYSVFVDTDGDGATDTRLQGGVAPVNGRLSFNGLLGGGYVVTGHTVFDVRFDVAASTVNDRLQLRLDGIAGERLDTGAGLTSSQIVLTPGVGPLFTIWPQGSLYVTAGTTPVPQRQLLAGAQNPAVMQVTLRAETEDIDVTKLRFVVIGGQSVDTLFLRKEGETSPFGAATIAGNGSDPVWTSYAGQPASTFTGHFQSRQLVVLKGQQVTILVEPRLKSDVDGAVRGSTVQVVLPGSPFVVGNGGLHSVAARGEVSSNEIQANGGGRGQIVIGGPTANVDLVGVQHVVVGSKIDSVTNADPNPDGTSVPTGVTPIAQHRFVNAANNNTLYGTDRTQLTKLTYVVNATNVLLDAAAFRLYNKADQTIWIGAQISQNGVPITSGGITGTFTVEVHLSGGIVQDVINAGGNEVFVLQANVLNPRINAAQASALQATLDLNPGKVSLRHLDAVFSQSLDWLDLPDRLIRGTQYRD